MSDDDYKELIEHIARIRCDIEVIKTKINAVTSVVGIVSGLVSSIISGAIIIFFK